MSEWLELWQLVHRFGLTDTVLVVVLWWLNARIEALEDESCDD